MIPVGYVVTAVVCVLVGAAWGALFVIYHVLPATIEHLRDECYLLLASKARRDAERPESDSTRNVSGGMRGC
jgi:hypothetical protein